MSSNLWAQDSDAASGDPFLAPDCILSAVLTPSPKPDAAFKALLAGTPENALATIPANDADGAAEPNHSDIDLSLIAAMAGRGLTLDEIASLLDQPLPTDATRRHAVEAAWRRGRLVGLARIKDANYEAALKGGVTAQKHVLDLLREPALDDHKEAEGVTVVRRMLEAPDDNP